MRRSAGAGCFLDWVFVPDPSAAMPVTSSSTPFTLSRRGALRTAAGAALAACGAGSARASGGGWSPADRVDYIVPSGAGAALDMAARRLGQILEAQKLAKSIVVSNKAGGAGQLALHVLQQSAGNGNVLSSLSSSFLTGHATGTLSARIADFTPVAILVDEFVTVAVRADSPIRDARDLAARLRQNPQAHSIGVASSLGNHIHIGIARPLKLGGVDVGRLTVAPFKSSAESMNALLGGHIDVVSSSTPNVIAHLNAGRIRVLAVDAADRLGGALAAVPTWREQGFDVVGVSSQGILAPKGIPPAALDYWVRALRTATRTPEWKEFVATNQLREHFVAGADAAGYLDRQYGAMTVALRDLGLLDRTA